MVFAREVIIIAFCLCVATAYEVEADFRNGVLVLAAEIINRLNNHEDTTASAAAASAAAAVSSIFKSVSLVFQNSFEVTGTHHYHQRVLRFMFDCCK